MSHRTIPRVLSGSFERHPGRTAIIVTEEFDADGTTLLTDEVVGPSVARVVIPRPHSMAPRDPEPLATAIGEILSGHGLG